MATIRITQNFCRLEDESDTEFLRALDDELSYKVQGSEYMGGRWSNHRWDGIQRLMKGDASFAPGLLGRVKDFCDRNKKEWSVVDERTKKSSNLSIDILPALKKIGIEPYPYQLRVAETAWNEDCGIIRAATGSGKGIMMQLITAHFGKSTIIYVIGCDLLYQIHRAFSSAFSDKKIGIIGDGLCDIQDINIVSVWTLGQALGMKKKDILLENEEENSIDPHHYREIRQMLSDTKIHIFDECHLAACSTIQEIVKNSNPEHIYGMSASPWRDDGADLLIESALGKRIVDISASYCIENGYLVKPIIKFLKVPPLADKTKHPFQTMYKNYITENPTRNALVLHAAEKLVEQNYQTLVLFSSVAHGVYLHEQLSKRLPCILLSGKDSSDIREAAKRQLEDRKINCVLASRIFDIGVDIPSLSGLVLASGGKSSVRALQRVGRVIRKAKEKRQAAVVDFMDNAHYLKDHAKRRLEIYKTEPAFEIHLPK